MSVLLRIEENEKPLFKPIGHPVYASKKVVSPDLLKGLSLQVFAIGLLETTHLIGYLIVPIPVRRGGPYQVLVIFDLDSDKTFLILYRPAIAPLAAQFGER